MDSNIWIIGTLILSIIMIVFSIVRFKLHPFLALLLASFRWHIDGHATFRDGKCH